MSSEPAPPNPLTGPLKESAAIVAHQDILTLSAGLLPQDKNKLISRQKNIRAVLELYPDTIMHCYDIIFSGTL